MADIDSNDGWVGSFPDPKPFFYAGNAIEPVVATVTKVAKASTAPTCHLDDLRKIHCGLATIDSNTARASDVNPKDYEDFIIRGLKA